jgi:hypothetical protein
VANTTALSSSLKRQQKYDNRNIEEEELEQKIASIIQGIEGDNDTNNVHYITAQLNRLKLQSKENVLTICDYITALINETNLVPQYKRTQIQILCYLADSYYKNNHNNHNTNNKKKKQQQQQQPHQQEQQSQQQRKQKKLLFSEMT